MAKIMFQGHGSLRLISDSGIVVYIDPYAGIGYDVPADIILVTHQHMDHNCIEKPAKKPDNLIIQNFDALKKGSYKSFTVKDITVEAVPAYNKNHPVKIDYAFFPTDGKFNMNEIEASECAQIVGSRHSTPVHMLPGKLFSEEKAAGFHADGKLIIRPGEKIELD